MAYHRNKSFYQQIIQTFQSIAIAYTLFDYINGGGRNPSIITLVCILMNQPENLFVSYAKSYMRNGGTISPSLCKLTGEIDDEFCLLASLSFPDDGYPSLDGDPRITVLCLAKLLLNNEFHSSVSDVVFAYEKTNSKMARCLVSKFKLDVPEDKIKPMEGNLEDLSDVKDYLDWTLNTISSLYLYNMSYLFKGTKIKNKIPDYKGIEQYVICGA